MIAATVLSAGASTRMGSPKALLAYRGQTFLESILEKLAALNLERLVAVGHDADKILSQHDLRGVATVANQHLSHGPIGSIRASIQAVADDPIDGLLVWPVDFPHVKLETVRALIDRFASPDQPPIVVPTFNGRGGHPVLFGKDVFPELLESTGSEGARSVVRRDKGRVARVSVTDRAVVDCINTPGAYRDLIQRKD